MQNITTVTGLKDAIKVLEAQQTEKGRLLKEQLVLTYESLKPVNILKSTLKELFSGSHGQLGHVVTGELQLTFNAVHAGICLGHADRFRIKVEGVNGFITQFNCANCENARAGADIQK